MTLEQRVSSFLAEKIPGYYCLAMWSFGSTVYKNKEADDHDLYVVIKHDPAFGLFYMKFEVENYDIQVVCEKTFDGMLNDHHIAALECINAPMSQTHVMNCYYVERLAKFEINLGKLRESISKVSSNSYVKAKKKIIVEADFDLESSVKSLWHSLRILQFGTQLATTGSIENFAQTNDLYAKIIQNYIETGVNWDEIHKIWKPIHNEYSSAFKAIAHKAVSSNDMQIAVKVNERDAFAYSKKASGKTVASNYLTTVFKYGKIV